jgi:hypothetical protein
MNHVGLHAKLWAPKVARVPFVGISGLPLGSLRTKSHLDVAPVERCKVYYKGRGGAFHEVRAMVSLVNPSCSWLVLAPKVLKLCTNHLVLVLCRFVWIVEDSQFFLVPFRSSSTPLYPWSAVSQGLCPDSLPFHCFHFRLSFESIKEFGSALGMLRNKNLKVINQQKKWHVSWAIFGKWLLPWHP